MIQNFRRLAASVFLASASVLTLSAEHATAENGASLTLGLGGQYSNSYLGSKDYSLGPAGKFSVHRLSLGPLQFGSPDPNAEKLGFGLRGAFEIIGARKAKDHPELNGLNDLKTSVEIGFGLGYESTHWRAFGDLRYGVVGHKATIVELGADWKAISTPEFKLSLGPRVLYGSDRFNRTYFGVTPAESAASGTLAAFAPGAGVVSTGIEIGMAYDLGNDWGVEGTISYDRLQGDAANSPITAQGSRNQGSVSVVLTRRISLGF